MQDSSFQDNSFSFWKNLVLTTLFFSLTPIILGVSLFSLLSLSNSRQTISNLDNIKSQNTLKVFPIGIKVYASLPVAYPSILGVTTATDARSEIIRQYLDLYRSPLTPYYQQLVDSADQYGLDFRLTTAIAQKESGLCKIIPPQSYNCWGWGIHAKGTLGFSSYEEGIKEVSRGLAEEYLAKGYTTVEEIMSKYTPLSNGSWARDVTYFMSEME